MGKGGRKDSGLGGWFDSGAPSGGSRAVNEARVATRSDHGGGSAAGGWFETANVDSDMRNEAAWQARPEYERKWKDRQAKEASTLANKHQADVAGVKAASVTMLDTDHTDEEAWKARKMLKERSAERKRREARELAEANRRYFESVAATKRSDLIDDNLMDEEEWQLRPDLDAQNRRLKQREADDLRIKNGAATERIINVRPKIVITSPMGLEEWDKPNYVDALVFDSRDWIPRTREKYVSRLNWTASAPTTLSKRPPSWLRPWEQYDWGELAGALGNEGRATAGYDFGIEKDKKIHEQVVARQKYLIATGQMSDAKNGLATRSGVY